MYIIELIFKKLTRKKDKPVQDLFQINTTEANYDACKHMFMPVDSTGEVLSCTKCGFLMKKSEIEKQTSLKKNFFIKED